MKDLAHRIEETQVPDGSVAIWWLAQAGFVFKSHAGTVMYLDPYLSNIVEKKYGFKRLSLSPIDADDVRADWIISTHEHEDHLDTDALPIIARNNPFCRFAGSFSCEQIYDECGIPKNRQLLMQPDGTYEISDVTIYTARADHGDQCVDALTLLLDFGGVSILFSGDTSLRPEWMHQLLLRKPDVLIPCINGAFGNMDASQAAELTAIVQPRLAIPCHFWMFKEQNGDPEAFIKACDAKCPSVKVNLLRPGERLILKPSAVNGISEISEKIDD